MTPTPLQQILAAYRHESKTKREMGMYFEELIRTYLRHEPVYADLYADVWLLNEVPKELGISKKDTGIDLVARTYGNGELHAIQCKFYDDGHSVTKRDIDSFFTASGQKPFSHRLIVVTTNNWTDNAEASLFNQQPPVSRIELSDLENSRIDWSDYKPRKTPNFKEKFTPRPHQAKAISRVIAGLGKADRGKLIMACGTGKTFTSLKIAERLAGKDSRVLFLVPSLALLSQTLTEWTQQSEIPLHCFAVCSDSEVGKKREVHKDIVETFVHELRYPATTNAERLADALSKRHDSRHMSVVFSTYQSIEVVQKSQHEFAVSEFDLIICDEAHRTTGATFESDTESAFVRVHDQEFIRAKKRLYMTATPRIYGDSAKATADQQNVAICSMDDESLYGKELHVISFSEAVELDLLTDYKVIVLTIDEEHVSSRLQNLLKDDNNQLKVDDAARIIGCWKALSKQGLRGELSDDPSPMKRAVAFCQVIEASKGKRHKISSKQISSMFQEVVEAYIESADDEEAKLRCESEHVDGSMNASQKGEKIDWLKAPIEGDVCRVLSNVRCLSEGVDVPALDAVLFLSPRSSQVEVVQSVGRVMRKAKGKDLGYVVLPVVIPHGMKPHEALADNKVYKVVWEVLQALRSHDDRFDSFINKVDLMESTAGRMEVVAITDSIQPKTSRQSESRKGKGTHALAAEVSEPKPQQYKMHFEVGELEKALYAKLVKKCGNRLYWEDWASDIAKIAQTHISRISKIVQNENNTEERKAFAEFADELRDDLNDSITDEEVIEMLAQHLITKPVFDALFADYSFASHNPVSQGMQNVLDLLQEHRLDKEADTLEQFYASVRRRADGIDKAEGKQKIVVELYDKFFRKAFPKMTERLGIVYTPVEVVDFIIHSVNDILRKEFGQTLGSEDVHILDPFVGTGTFITRLMQSGLISPEQLPHKYKHEIHCNEIVLLAYYIAAINIEAVYHSIMSDEAKAVGGEAPVYEPFDGICLTDTFQMYESDDLIEQFFPDNSERRKRQKKLDIRVIVGNPPYSALQENENDNNRNVRYSLLDDRIRKTYADKSSAVLKNALYDSYVRAIRWASDRIAGDGVIGFVTNASFIEGRYADGLRAHLSGEFSSIRIFHLRGNARTAGEERRKEKDNVFGQGTKTPVAITFLVKKDGSKDKNKGADIRWHDVGDYLTRAEKLAKLQGFQSIARMRPGEDWEKISPNQHHDWINQRDDTFFEFQKSASKTKSDETIFRLHSSGVKTNRDAWCYNFSRKSLIKNMSRMITFYNKEVQRYEKATNDAPGNEKLDVSSFLNSDPKQISWTREIKADLSHGKTHSMNEKCICRALYRPFQKSWMYFSRDFNNCVYKMPTLFPYSDSKNLLICVNGAGSQRGFSSLITHTLPDFHSLQTGQCFPLYVYEPPGTEERGSLFDEKNSNSHEAGIQALALKKFSATYNVDLSNEDLFYYIYGLLHSPEYRERYKDNLSKELPRIPAVKRFEDFQAFSQAGRDLAHWHLDYETVDCHPVALDFTAGDKAPQSLQACKDEHFYVRKMKFPKVKDPETGKRGNDKTTVIYNDYITVRDIPLEAYDYVVNGKSAIEWVMERQALTTDNKSGIVNDANLWATETMNNAAYPLELLMRVITVSLETMRIVRSLPKLELD
ncbi:MAG: type ISP restriction/modification enzyme [Pseudomonadota bacterium]